MSLYKIMYRFIQYLWYSKVMNWMHDTHDFLAQYL